MKPEQLLPLVWAMLVLLGGLLVALTAFGIATDDSKLLIKVFDIIIGPGFIALLSAMGGYLVGRQSK